jgi:hypothetical protein
MDCDERKERKKAYRDWRDKKLNDSNLISGIFNYCDRWCEKCTFTERCLVFQTEMYDNMEVDDLSNQKFWDNISLNFEVSMDMLYEMAAENGVDIDALADAEMATELADNSTSNLQKMAKALSLDCMFWSKNNREYFNEILSQLSAKDLNVQKQFSDAIEIVNWYSIMIGPKIHRASAGKLFTNEAETQQSNGSAKVALIAIERSLMGFRILYDALPEKRDEIIDFLARLAHVKKRTLSAYPNAMSFKRPGFDD